MSGNLHEQRSATVTLRRAALDRFAKDGFANVTVAELAEEAGVTQRTFFRHSPPRKRCCSPTTRRTSSGSPRR
jgi:hypothetical protein